MEAIVTAFCKFLGNIEEVVPEDVNRFLATCPSNHDVQLQRKHLLHAHFKLNFDPVLPYDILSPNVAAHAINNVDLELRSRVMLYLRFKCNKSFVTLCRMHCGEMSLHPPWINFCRKASTVVACFWIICLQAVNFCSPHCATERDTLLKGQQGEYVHMH